MTHWLLDFRYALRRLVRRPGESLLAVVILAVGLGATTAIFSVVRGVLLTPVNLPDAERLVVLWTTNQASGLYFNNSGPNVLNWQRRDDLFTGLFPFLGDTLVVEARDGSRERIDIAHVGADAFDVVGLPLALGRAFTAEEEGPGRSPRVVLDHGYWRSRFGGRRDVLGTLLSIDGQPHEIIGVTAPGFSIPKLPDRRLYLPFDQDLEGRGRDQVWLGAAGRLRPEVSIENAQAALSAMHEGLTELHPELTGSGVTVRSVRADLIEHVRTPLEALMAGAAFVLLLACANVANLLLARLVRRRDELALRRALGASDGRVLRQLATENALLAIGAVAVGLGIVALSRQLLPLAEPLGIPRLDLVRFDLPVVLFAVAVAILAVAFFASVPLSLIGRPGLGPDARGADRGGRRGRLRQVLVATQVAFASALLFGAGLLGHGLLTLVGTDPGFRPDGVVVADLQLPADAFADRPATRTFLARIESAAEDLPGVEQAGITMFPPMRAPRVNYAVLVGGREVPPVGQEPSADLGVATSGYFATLGIPLLSGRLFEEIDGDRPAEVVVNRAMANQLWDGASPIGERLGILFSREGPPTWHRVVGVVGNVKQTGLDAPDRPFVYLDMMQRAQNLASLVVRSSGPTAHVETALTRLVRDLDPRVPTPQIETLDSARDRTVARPRFFALLVAALAGVALTIAVGGIFGVLAHQVEDRRGEIGIRMSLGAGRGRIVGRVVGRELIGVAFGTLAGLVMALALAHRYETRLFGVESSDPATLAVIGLVILTATAMASLVPAIRAASVSPATALRRE